MDIILCKLWPLSLLAAADVGHYRAREIHGEAAVGQHGLHFVGVGQFLVAAAEGAHECGDVGGGVVETAGEGAQLRGVDEGFVALDVDNDIGVRAAQVVSLAHAVGAAAVVG